MRKITEKQNKRGRGKIELKNKIDKCLNKLINDLNQIFKLKIKNKQENPKEKINQIRKNLKQLLAENTNYIEVLKILKELYTNREQTLIRLKQHLIGLENFLEEKIPNETLKKLLKITTANIQEIDKYISKGYKEVKTLQKEKYNQTIKEITEDLKNQAKNIENRITKMEKLTTEIKQNIKEILNS